MGLDWTITPFESMGPIRFGLSPAQVEQLVGVPSRTRKGLRAGSFAEFRDNIPIVRYTDGGVSEIEAYYDLPGVTLQGIRLFEEDGLQVMRALARLNGGALESVGTVLFENIGITCGRLDQAGREDHSVTAFQRGLWDAQTDHMRPISFN